MTPSGSGDEPRRTDAEDHRPEVKRARTACPLDCPDGCSLEVEVVDGRLVRIDAAPAGTGDPTLNPLTQGFICHKVKRHHRRVYSSQRLQSPLVRTGPKGSGSWRSASWDEALDLVATRIGEARAQDPATVVPYLYSSSSGALGSGLLGPLLWEALGASAVDKTICAATAGRAWELTFGRMTGADLLDVVHADLVVVWGANPAISNTHFPPLVNQARRRGAALVVVDPRRTAMAARADLHLAPRPGTDVVLALAVAAELDRRGMVDRTFTDAHATGVDEYLAASRAWSLDRAAEVCGLDPAEIAALVDLVGSRRPAFWRPGWGLERNRNGGSAVRAVLALPVLSGAFGCLGSGVHLSTGHDLNWDDDGLRRAVLGPAAADPSRPRPARRHVNQNQLGQLLTEPGDRAPVRVLFIQGANPAVMNPAQAKVLDGLAREDLFTVVHDQVMTDTACLADVVLPATTHFEVDDVSIPYGAFVAEAIPAVIERVGQSRTNDEVTAGLATRLGFPADPGLGFDPTVERVRALALPGGVPGRAVLAEPDRAVQFRDRWPTYRDHRARLLAGPGAGEARVPGFAPLLSPLPLALLTPAGPERINSMFGEPDDAEVVTASGAPALRLHPDDAAARGLVAGQRARMWDERAEVEVVVTIDGDVRPGVAWMPKGSWRAAFDGGYTANVFAPDLLSDLAGGATFNDARVEVGAV